MRFSIESLVIIILCLLFILVTIILVIIFALRKQIVINDQEPVKVVDLPETSKMCKCSSHKRKRRRQIRLTKEGKIDRNTIKSHNSNESNEVSRSGLYIIDVCNYSLYTLYLMNDGSILAENGSNTREIESDIKITMMINYQGFLFSVSQGKLYYLNNNTLESNNWEWYEVDWSPSDILEISTPHDKSCLWIRCQEMGYLFKGEGELLEEIKSPYRRVYGTSSNNYISFDNNGDALLQPGQKILRNVKDAIIDHYGQLYIIGSQDKRFRMLKLIDWKPYFIP